MASKNGRKDEYLYDFYEKNDKSLLFKHIKYKQCTQKRVSDFCIRRVTLPECRTSIVFMSQGYDSKIKANLASKRKEAGLTQADVADLLGIDRNTYRNIETGATMVINPHLPKLCEILKCSVEELILGYDPSRPETNPNLEDIKASYGSRFTSTIEELRRQNEKYQASIEAQGERIRFLQEMLQDKNDIIKFLRAQNKSQLQKNSK